MNQTITALRALERSLYAYHYAQNVIDYDSETVAPAGSSAGRAEAMEVLSKAEFDLLVNPDTAALLAAARDAAETEQEAAEVRELQRRYDEIHRIPAAEYAAFTRLVQQSIPVWVQAKRSSDFSLFAPYLEQIVEARRSQARYFDPDRDPYEVWLDRYERGLTIAACDDFFATLRGTIVPLLAEIGRRGAPVRTDSWTRTGRWRPSGRCRPKSWRSGGWIPPTVPWGRASTPSPPSSGGGMCGSPPTICPGTSFPTCTAWPTRPGMPCMS